jgi:hypothetical protein
MDDEKSNLFEVMKMTVEHWMRLMIFQFKMMMPLRAFISKSARPFAVPEKILLAGQDHVLVTIDLWNP